MDCFLKSAQINVNLFNNRPEELILPAFYHTYEFKVNKKLGVLKPHPIVCKLFKEYLASQGEISMETTSVPMLVPPRPWRATKDGAYLILPGLRTLSELCFREQYQSSQSFLLKHDNHWILRTSHRFRGRINLIFQLVTLPGKKDLCQPGTNAFHSLNCSCLLCFFVSTYGAFEYLKLWLKTSNNQRLGSAGDNDRKNKRFCSIAMLCVCFT